MIRDMVIKTLYELMLPESADEKRAYAELIIRELDALRERAEKSEAMVEQMAKEIKEQSTTIDVLIKKHSNVQFVNKKLQEKIKRQAERITQLEALYREEIKTKKQDALRERAERAEAMVELMIEAGNRLCELAEELDDLVDEFRAYPDLFSWRALVAEWKERKDE